VLVNGAVSTHTGGGRTRLTLGDIRSAPQVRRRSCGRYAVIALATLRSRCDGVNTWQLDREGDDPDIRTVANASWFAGDVLSFVVDLLSVLDPPTLQDVIRNPVSTHPPF
jgi:hypothetical protein